MLRHCITSRKVADSIPDGVCEIIPWINLSGGTTALESTQILTEINTKNIACWVKTAGA
jgi:hypothetical protein